MKRHSFNLFSFGFGLVLILLAVGIVLQVEFRWFGMSRWLLPLGLIVVGASMLGTLFNRSKSDPDLDAEPVEVIDEPSSAMEPGLGTESPS